MRDIDLLNFSINTLEINDTRISPELKHKKYYGIEINKDMSKNHIFKVLKHACENRDSESIKIVNEVYSIVYKEFFEGAKKCLINKERIEFIDTILN